MYNTDKAICFNMLEAANKIFDISKSLTSVEDFKNDYIRFDAIMMNFVVIGEMVSKLSGNFKNNHSDIEWRKINSFRNIIAHDYFGIDDKEIWQILHNKLPQLKNKLEKVLDL
ncbi:MAG: DUF86 domain-containing protein [Bacteroidales bacterium]|nr:DUF86 domain-containing protein [Bacteroidales bacterium]